MDRTLVDLTILVYESFYLISDSEIYNFDLILNDKFLSLNQASNK